MKFPTGVLLRRLTPLFYALVLCVSCTEQAGLRSQHPILGRNSIEAVLQVEDHSEALTRWARSGVKDATLVNIDTHDDLRWIPEEKIEALKALFAKKDWAAFEMATKGGDARLYDAGSFIYAAARLGMVREVYWIIPLTLFTDSDADNRLRGFLRTYGFAEKDVQTFVQAKGCFRGRTHGVPLTLCGIEALPDIEDPLILSIDVDFFPPLASSYGVSKLMGLKMLFEELYEKRYTIQDAVVSYSVNGGYLSTADRWLGDASAEALKAPEVIQGLPPKLWRARQQADIYFTQNRAGLLIEHLSPYLQEDEKDPSLLMYMAFALYGVGNLDGALSSAERACLVNRGYCFGLADIGQNLLDTHRLSDALKFFERAYSLYPEMNYRQMNLAKALRKEGLYKEALEYFETYRSMNGSFPVDFLMGETYLLMGDEGSALEHFDRGRESLARTPYPDITNQENAKAVSRAIDFYEKKGFAMFARYLRTHPKLKKRLEASVSSGTP